MNVLSASAGLGGMGTVMETEKTRPEPGEKDPQSRDGKLFSATDQDQATRVRQLARAVDGLGGKLDVSV
jgi:hypothetical protein